MSTPFTSEAASPTLRLNRERLSELVKSLTMNRDKKKLNILDMYKWTQKEVKNYFLADIRRET